MLFFCNIFDYYWCYHALINNFHQICILFKYFKCQFLEEELESVPHPSSVGSASLAFVGKLPPIDTLFFHFPTMYFIKRSNSVHVGYGFTSYNLFIQKSPKSAFSFGAICQMDTENWKPETSIVSKSLVIFFQEENPVPFAKDWWAKRTTVPSPSLCRTSSQWDALVA